MLLSVNKTQTRLRKFFLEANRTQGTKSCPEYHQPMTSFAPSSIDITRVTAFFQKSHDKLILQVFSNGFQKIHVQLLS